MAYTFPWSDVDRYVRSWMGTASGGPIEEIRPGDIAVFLRVRSTGMEPRRPQR
jgi:hypothetical protein